MLLSELLLLPSYRFLFEAPSFSSTLHYDYPITQRHNYQEILVLFLHLYHNSQSHTSMPRNFVPFSMLLTCIVMSKAWAQHLCAMKFWHYDTKFSDRLLWNNSISIFCHSLCLTIIMCQEIFLLSVWLPFYLYLIPTSNTHIYVLIFLDHPLMIVVS